MHFPPSSLIPHRLPRLFPAALLTVLGLFPGSPTEAATLTNGPAAPAIDGKDIANYSEQTSTDKWFTGTDAASAAKGQTFRVGAEALRLKAVTYRTTRSSQPAKTFTIRVGTVSGTAFTQTHSESATQSVAWAAQDYVTWTFATPVLLQPNTLYGIDVGMVSSTTSASTGIPYLSVTDDDYLGGSRYQSGSGGVGTAALTDLSMDRVFHLDLEKPIGPGWNIVAVSPADGAVNVPNLNPPTATFSQNIVRGTGNVTLRNLSNSTDLVIPVGDPRISISENLLTIRPGGALLANTSFAIRIDPTAIVNASGVAFPGITNDTTWNFTTGAGDPLLLALNGLKSHITGTPVLSAAQISEHKLTVDRESYRLADDGLFITASFDLVSTYDSVLGPLFVARGLPGRSSVTNDIHYTIYSVMQHIMDVTYSPATLAKYEALLNNYKFGSSASFPGPCNPPPVPDVTHAATVSASYLDTRGRYTQNDGPDTFARKPTGCYLAPGSIATVTVPAALVGKGYKIRVGAHAWDFSRKPLIKRLDRSSLVYNITSTETKIASPLGGGIYLEVPFLANAGVVNIQVKNAVRSPYFSAKSFHQTTVDQWLTERAHTAPWADFQTDRFMMQVPTSWIYAMPDPTQLMRDWDASMDSINDLMGFPRLRGKETMYHQVDVLQRSAVFSPGYPAVNVGGYSATANVGGYSNHYLVRGPQTSINSTEVEFHEQGHAYFFPKFEGENESTVNLLYVPVLHQNFGYSLDAAFRASLGGNTFQTLDTTAIAWMTVFNFSPREVPMADSEKAYQFKGHAKFVDIARLYGWGAVNSYFSSMVDEEENGLTVSEATDSLILRLCKAVGRDVRPLLHFWGIHPQNPAALSASLAAEGITAPAEIYDTLVRYKSLIPANNAAFRTFAQGWWGRQPTMSGNWEEREHARQWDTTALYGPGDQQRSEATNPGEIYNENSALDINNRVQELINLYYPAGRPADTTPPAVFAVSPAPGAIRTPTSANLVVTFTEAIAVGTGNITIKNLTQGTQSTISITDANQVSISGPVLTINPTANLSEGKDYAIRISAGSIRDLAGNSSDGISNDTTWSFSTVPDITAPTLAGTNFVDNKGGAPVAVGTLVSYTVTFSEDMDAGTVSATDFGNAGTSAVAIGSVTESSAYSGVFTVLVTPTTVGTLQLRINASAVVKDASGNSLATTSAIADNTTLSSINTAPVANAQSVTTSEDTSKAITLVATDADGHPLTYSIVTAPARGTLSGTPPNLTYTPEANINGTDSFTFRANDGYADSANATVTITVSAVNDAPVFSSGTLTRPEANGGVSYTGQTLAGTASDVDANSTLTYSKVSGPTWLSVAADGALSGTPASSNAGTNSFSIRVTDNAGATAMATLNISVRAFPLPWELVKLGTTNLSGGATHSNGAFTLTGSGILAGTADTGQFLYQTLTADGSITARITNLQNTGGSCRVGVMVRNTLANNSPHVYMGLSGTNSYFYGFRTTTGGSSTFTGGGTGTVPNTWVRITRASNTFTCWKSADGVTWTKTGAVTTTFASTCYLGLWISSSSNTTANTSTFNNVSVIP